MSSNFNRKPREFSGRKIKTRSWNCKLMAKNPDYVPKRDSHFELLTSNGSMSTFGGKLHMVETTFQRSQYSEENFWKHHNSNANTSRRFSQTTSLSPKVQGLSVCRKSKDLLELTTFDLLPCRRWE
jgi:hypothetical protein